MVNNFLPNEYVVAITRQQWVNYVNYLPNPYKVLIM